MWHLKAPTDEDFGNWLRVLKSHKSLAADYYKFRSSQIVQSPENESENPEVEPSDIEKDDYRILGMEGVLNSFGKQLKDLDQLLRSIPGSENNSLTRDPTNRLNNQSKEKTSKYLHHLHDFLLNKIYFSSFQTVIGRIFSRILPVFSYQRAYRQDC